MTTATATGDAAGAGTGAGAATGDGRPVKEFKRGRKYEGEGLLPAAEAVPGLRAYKPKIN